MPVDDATRIWMVKLDGLAEQANDNLKIMFKRANEDRPEGDVIAGCLIAIASQLAYGNAVAAATFYMQNRLWITTTEENQ